MSRLVLCLLLLEAIHLTAGVLGIGINYGMLGTNLTKPAEVAKYLQRTLIRTIKIYDTNPDILSAFADTGIDVIVAVENEMVANLSSSTEAAASWFKIRLASFLQSTSVVGIAVGNEYLTAGGKMNNGSALVTAMRNIQAVLVNQSLERQIKVWTPHAMDVLNSSFPPSSSVFRNEFMPIMKQIVRFSSSTGAPMAINAYPYFAYAAAPDAIKIEYALGNATETQVLDPRGFKYTSLLQAQIDAFRTAVMATGAVRGTVEIAVTETGWPSAGGVMDTAASPENAATYIGNLISDNGLLTPMEPRTFIQVFLFALFDEDRKPGRAVEKNFGFFHSNMSIKYPIDITCSFCNSTPAGAAPVRPPAGGGLSVWCVAKPHADEYLLSGIYKFVCQQGIDCGSVAEGGRCFHRSVHARASYAMNAYYHLFGRNFWNCDFSGAGMVTFTDPSYGNCSYPNQ